MPEKKKLKPKKKTEKAKKTATKTKISLASKKKQAKTEEKEEKKGSSSDVSYVGAIGRRKTSIARVRIYKKEKKEIKINKKDFSEYFPEIELKKVVLAPLKKADYLQRANIEILVKGGGKRGQAEASRLGIARALLKINSDLRSLLKAEGYLRRDPREKERKKFGLKKARKAPQWSKR